MTPGESIAADHRRLLHIVDAIDRATRYTAGGRRSLDHDETHDAVLHCLTVVGEALGALSPDTFARLASLPAGRPRNQRNIIVHEYWRVDPDIVWETIRTSLPRLRAEVDAVLRDASGFGGASR